MNNDGFYQYLVRLSDGNQRSLETLIGYALLCPHKGLKPTLACMEKYGITGNKISKLYAENCNNQVDKLIKTMQVLSQNVYSKDQIQANLNSKKAIEFISSKVVLTMDENYMLNKFDDEVVAKYAKLNAQIVKPKLEKLLAENQIQTEKE